jgi:hypothetical protein
MPCHKCDAVGIVKVVTGNVQVRLAPPQPRAKAVEAEVRPSNAFGYRVSVVLKPSTVRRQYGDLCGMPWKQRAIEVSTLAVIQKELSEAVVIVLHASVVWPE